MKPDLRPLSKSACALLLGKACQKVAPTIIWGVLHVPNRHAMAWWPFVGAWREMGPQIIHDLSLRREASTLIFKIRSCTARMDL